MTQPESPENRSPIRPSRSYEQMQHMEGLRRVFNLFDTESTGRIDLPTLVVVMKELGVTSSIYVARRVLESMDRDENGSVDYEEFCRFFETASNIEEVKSLLTKEARKFLEYKLDAESGNPNFAQKYKIPPCAKPTTTHRDHSDVVESVSWLGELDFVSASLDGSVTVWSTESTAPKARIPLGSTIYSLAIVDRSHVAVGHGVCPTPLRLLDLSSGKVTSEFGGTNGSGIASIDSFQSTLVVGSLSGSVLLYDTSSDLTPTQSIACSSSAINSVSINRKSPAISVAADYSGYISLIDTRSSSAYPVSVFEAALGRVSAVAFLHEFEIVSGGDDFVVRKFDLRKVDKLGGAVGCFLGHTAPITSLAVQGNVVLSGSLDGSIRVWNDGGRHHTGSVQFVDPFAPSTGEEEKEPEEGNACSSVLIGHSQAVKSIDVRHGGARGTLEILSGSSDTCVNRYSLVNRPPQLGRHQIDTN